MAIIIIDTCIFENTKDYFFSKPKLKLVHDLAENMIIIPNIVFDEIVSHCRDTFKDLQCELEKINEKIEEKHNKLKPYLLLRCYNTNTIKDKEIDVGVDMFKEQLQKAWTNWNIFIEDYPAETSINEILQRIYLRKKPFKKSGDNGFKDFLIWKTIIKLLEKYPDSEIIFLTNNTNDFLENEKTPKDFLADLESKNIDFSRIKIETLDKYLKNIIQIPADSFAEKLNNIVNDLLDLNLQIEDAKKNKYSFDRFINENISEITNRLDISSDCFGYAIELCCVESWEFKEHSIICKEINENELFIEFGILANVEGCIGEFSIGSGQSEITINIIYDNDLNIVTSIQVDSAILSEEFDQDDIYEAECDLHLEFVKD